MRGAVTHSQPDLSGDRPPRRPDWKAAFAGLLSSVVPGIGQVYAGSRRRGGLMLGLSALCLVAAAFLGQALREPGAMARLVQPEVLLILLVGNVLLLCFRVASAADAFWLGARREPAGGQSQLVGWRQLPVALIAVLVFTTAPHAVAAWYNVKTYELVTTVFDTGPIGSRFAGSAAGASGDGSQPVALEPLTVLLIGGDAGPGRSGLRTDTMIVARIDPATGHAALFGLPRNLIQVPLRGAAADFFGVCRCFPQPLNELYAFAEDERPDLFPGPERPGINALMGAAGTLLGLKVDYYALADLKGFVGIVDALGGVTVDVQQRVWVEIDHLGERHGGRAYFMNPGRRHLDGLTALAYARSRDEKNDDGANDYGRMRRQRCLLGSLAAQADPTKLLTSFTSLVEVLKDSVKTNIPIRLMPDLIVALSQHRPRTTTIGFAPPTFNAGWAGGFPIPDTSKIRRTVRDTIAAPPASTKPPASVTTTTRRANPDGDNSGRKPRNRRTATTLELDPSSHIADTCGSVS
jgi:polyisoprenyl-teichoic acid--peptidoglycan teichoic acid transferase